MTHQGSLPSSLHPVEGCDLPSSGQANERGGEILIFLTDEDRKRRKRLLKVMTKLKGPRHQVTLSQIPSSQKEMWGVENNPHFQAHPH